MSFSVGVLYSTQSFLEFVKVHEINGIDFPNMFKKFVVADAKMILDTSLECKWVKLKPNNQLMVTQRGEEILEYIEPYKRLRVQLTHMVETFKPSWTALICFGRSEALKYFSDEVKQCFAEAYLLDGYENDIIEWWDKLAAVSRGMHEDIRLEIGRKGELLSIQFEKLRTDVVPVWQSIESNFSGYDILSQIDHRTQVPLKIEVKASTSKSDISFVITQGEWYVAEKSTNYTFHIWSLYPKEELFIITKEEMKSHIPSNKGYGRWESVEISIDRDYLQKYKRQFPKKIEAI